jgi:hypothetical protein
MAHDGSIGICEDGLSRLMNVLIQPGIEVINTGSGRKSEQKSWY